MKTALPLVALLLTGCQTAGGVHPDIAYCSQLFPAGSLPHGDCVMRRADQRQRVGMEGLRMLYSQAGSWSAPPSPRYGY